MSTQREKPTFAVGDRVKIKQYINGLNPHRVYGIGNVYAVSEINGQPVVWVSWPAVQRFTDHIGEQAEQELAKGMGAA